MASVYHHCWYSMNTRFELVIPSPETGTEGYIAENVMEILVQTERMLSRYVTDGPVVALNNHAFQRAVKVPKELYDFIQQCCSFSVLTHGYFDITCGRLKTGDKMPDNAGVVEPTTVDLIYFEPGYSVRFGNQGIQLDFGAVGKGYALSKVINFLTRLDVKNAFLSFGESSIYALGSHPFGKGWMVGIRHISDPHRNVLTIPCLNQGISTSGIRKSVSVDGIASESFHIYNPLTGQPIHHRCTISVVCESPVVAEVLSTALYAAPRQNWGTIFDNFHNIRIYGVEYSDNTNFETFEHDIPGKEKN